MTSELPGELTDRQREVVSTIEDFRGKHGYSPSVRDMMKSLGIGSTNGIVCHLKALAKKGAIVWDTGTARSIRVLRQSSWRGRTCPHCNRPIDES
jgi:repressor LexA